MKFVVKLSVIFLMAISNCSVHKSGFFSWCYRNCTTSKARDIRYGREPMRTFYRCTSCSFRDVRNFIEDLVTTPMSDKMANEVLPYLKRNFRLAEKLGHNPRRLRNSPNVVGNIQKDYIFENTRESFADYYRRRTGARGYY